MADPGPKRSAEGPGGEEPPDDGRSLPPARRPGADAPPGDAAEPEKARAEIAAGDVADDLADFA